MKLYKKIMVAVLTTAATSGMMAQQTSRSAYFLEGATYRHLLNRLSWANADTSVCQDWVISM